MIAAQVKYKKTGIDWMPEVPEHWEIVRLKNVTKIVSGATPKSSVSANWDGNINWVTPAEFGDEMYIGESVRQITKTGLESCAASLVPIGSIIISNRAPIGSLGISKVELCTNQGCKSIIPTNINNYFLYFVMSLQKENLNVLGNGTTFRELATPSLRNYKIPLPPKEEQDKIAEFLYSESAKITRFIQTKQRFIELLKEQRQSIITNAVAKGIDDGVKMKETGINWMTEVPEHWILKRGNWVNDLGKEIITKEQLLSVKELLHYSIPSIQETGKPAVESGDTIDSNKQIVKPGDLLVSKLNPRKKTIVIVENDKDSRLLVASTEFVNLRCKDIDTDFAYYLYQSHLVTERISSTVQSSTNSHQRAYPDTIYKMWNYYPPTIEEQKRIVEHIKTETRTLDIAISKAEREIELIKEYREAMIAEAVTGKMKI